MLLGSWGFAGRTGLLLLFRPSRPPRDGPPLAIPAESAQSGAPHSTQSREGGVARMVVFLPRRLSSPMRSRPLSTGSGASDWSAAGSPGVAAVVPLGEVAVCPLRAEEILQLS